MFTGPGVWTLDATTKEDVAALSLTHKRESCGRKFTKQRDGAMAAILSDPVEVI